MLTNLREQIEKEIYVPNISQLFLFSDELDQKSNLLKIKEQKLNELEIKLKLKENQLKLKSFQLEKQAKSIQINIKPVNKIDEIKSPKK